CAAKPPQRRTAAKTWRPALMYSHRLRESRPGPYIRLSRAVASFTIVSNEEIAEPADGKGPLRGRRQRWWVQMRKERDCSGCPKSGMGRAGAGLRGAARRRVLMSTRRRERRQSAGDGRRSRPDPAVRPAAVSVETASGRRRFSSFGLFFLFLPLFFSLLFFAVYRRPRHETAAEGDSVLSVHDRGLVKTEISYREVLSVRIQEHSKVSDNASFRHFPNPVLAYVTPNSLGYEMAERFGSKLTHVSPVWYELKSEENKFILEGRHNADTGWISRVRANGKSLVLPRVVLESLPSEMLQKKRQREMAIRIIVAECKEMGYDGVVLESWSRWAMHGVLHDTDMRKKALVFIKELAMSLHSVGSSTNPSGHLELVYVISPPRSQDLQEHDFGPNDLQDLSDAVDGFSLMTYDFSGPQSPGPNAPLLWIKSCLQLLLGYNDAGKGTNASKILLGINLYGNDFVLAEGLGGEAVIGRDYLSLLQQHRPELQWENRSAEHFFVYTHENIRHAVFYPSLMSISMRLDEAKAWGAGLSIWEIGQGLEYFFDLL
ncbi:hypothetical protein Taro_044192, partial [Colocasia esculenta]|nr:hypothetical protein [Colocasia esculenta]